ncbi:hypothetical protein L9G74_14465 [Shewanella sp. C32]|uniref:Outer membrane protein/protective antigen OMA87 n=1 Tax=Shewanella electrica TaxID=515560 RepID=A0ABT2FMT2_9GAMM|nr:hypothetical protein [Shewanella electrica]MCH1926185.1 hypothetical protein [Shewanella electrica]MCS4557650.1 hypothetical protein [Shewanella electrica]
MPNCCRVVLLIACLVSCSVIAATAPIHAEELQYQVGKIIVLSNPIFDESADNAIFLHHWANALHVNTREYVIRDRLSFHEGDIVTRKTLDEAQRILRAEPYLRDARIRVAEADPSVQSQQGTVNILVETWDQWSLLPTIDFGRSGGKNHFALGIKDDNILGSGIQSELEYQTDEDRNGYKIKVEAPISWVKHGEIAGDFTSNNDGTAAFLAFKKPFYTLADNYSYGASYSRNNRINTFRQNGEDVSEYRERAEFNNLFWGVKFAESASARQRLRVGITQDFHDFDSEGSRTRIPIPQDREFLYPWLSWEYLQDDFVVLQNIHLINYNEDLNLGWHHSAKIGLETHDNDGLGYHFWWETSRGYSSEQQLLLLNAELQLTRGTTQVNFYSASTNAEYFYRFNRKWVAYSHLRLQTSKNRYLDWPAGLGDANGVRGYPNEFQLGDQQWLFTAELRNYPNINLYQLAELGWVAFVDVGRAYGGELAEHNEISGPIGAVGVGARIYSSRSSYGNVVHIDFSMPFKDSEHVDGWEWRFEVKRQF